MILSMDTEATQLILNIRLLFDEILDIVENRTIIYLLKEMLRR